MKLRSLLPVVLALGVPAVVAACGSSGVDGSYQGGGGKPVTASGAKTDAGSASSSSGGSSSGGKGSSSSGSSSGGSSSGGDAGGDGATSFGAIAVASFTLIDASVTTMPLGAAIQGYDPIQYGAMIDLAVVGQSLSMRVTPPQVAQVGSMAFVLDSSYTHTADTAPYSLCGDDGKGNFVPCTLAPGKHMLTVTVYPQTELGGAPYQPPTVFEFTIVDSDDVDAGDDGADGE